MGRHRQILTPWRWPRRVLLTIAIVALTFLGMSAALAPGLWRWAQADSFVVATPTFGWGEVIADNPGKGTPPDLVRPST